MCGDLLDSGPLLRVSVILISLSFWRRSLEYDFQMHSQSLLKLQVSLQNPIFDIFATIWYLFVHGLQRLYLTEDLN